MIYLDYNATTPLCDDAREAMLPYLDRHFGNPSSVHLAGRAARAAIDNARDKLAALLRAKPHELIFTSGGTESCNLAVTARLHDSVPPLVKISSCGLARKSAASLSRALSMAARAARPAKCTLDGFPKCRSRYGSIASRASSQSGVVAL